MGISSCKKCNCYKEDEFSNMNKNMDELTIKSSEKENANNISFNNDVNINNLNKYNKIKSLTEIKIDKIKLIIKEFNISKILFLNEDNKNKEKIERENNKKIISKFYNYDGTQLKQLEKYLINLYLDIKYQIKKELTVKNYILSGYLKKLINYESDNNKIPKYCEKFFVLYPDILNYYKSEAQFLNNLRPLNSFYLKKIFRMNLVKLNNNSNNINHIVLCNNHCLSKTNNNNNSEYVIIFSSDKKEDIFKWYGFIQYILNENKFNNI